MREHNHMKWINPKVHSHGHHKNQQDNKFDSTIKASADQVLHVRENIHTYENSSCSELHTGKTSIRKSGKGEKEEYNTRHTL